MEELIKRCMPYIKRSANYSAASFKLDPGDVLSNILERIWRNRHTYRYENGDKGFENWVGVVTYSVCIDMYRIQKRSRGAVDISKARNVGVDYSIEHKDFLEKLMLFSQTSLTADFYKILTLRMEGLKYDEIAAELCQPVGTIKNKIFRIRKALEEANFGI